MLTSEECQARCDAMRAELRRAYGVKGKTLRDAVDRAGRRLPVSVRTALAPALEVETYGGHPKLLRRINPAALRDAQTALSGHLAGIDRGAARRMAVLNWVTLSAFYVLVVFGGVFAWMAMTDKV